MANPDYNRSINIKLLISQINRMYDEKLCNENQGNIKAILDDYEIRLNKYFGRLDELERDSMKHKMDIKNLIKKMDDFISTKKWRVTIFVRVSIFVIGILLKK